MIVHTFDAKRSSPSEPELKREAKFTVGDLTAVSKKGSFAIKCAAANDGLACLVPAYRMVGAWLIEASSSIEPRNMLFSAGVPLQPPHGR